jgi:hypothetical protein
LHLIGRAVIQFVGDLGLANDFLDVEEDRLAFMMAVRAAIVMAESLPEARENGLARPLGKLFQALWDVEQGSKNPLLTPVALYGQPLPDRRKIIQVWAVAWVKARYLRGEEDRKSAATARRATRMRMNALVRQAHSIASPLPRLGEALVCLRNARKYGLCNGAIYYASRDLHEGDKTIGVSTDAGDIEVPAWFLRSGSEYDRLDLPPGGWMTGFAFGYALTVDMVQGSEFDNVLLLDEWFRDDRVQWLYTGITHAKERITIASKGEPA